MSELDHEIRRGLERLTAPVGGSDLLTLNQLAARRRRRRVRHATLAALPIFVLIGLAAGIMAPGPGEGPTVAVESDNDDAPSPPAANQGVTVERTEVVGGDGGTARVTMEFDRPVPQRNVRHAGDITSLLPGDEIIYTTQEPDGVRVCESTHFFPPPSEGTVDVLIPADWFAEGEDTHTSPLETIANPSKVVVCGPHDGFFQYSIWGPVSADAADVDVTVDAGGTGLTIEIDSGSDRTTATTEPDLDQDDATAAESLVADFLDDLRRGDLRAAAERWTGYPEARTATVPERIPFIEDLLSDPGFSRVLGENTEAFVTASWGWTSAYPVVTVLAPRDGDDPPVAAAFLTKVSEDNGGPEAPGIQRLPQSSESTSEVADSYAEAGEQFVFDDVPVEGGARAYIGDTEIPVAVDHANVTMTITVPDDVQGDVAVTLSTGTPELPTAQAFAFTVH